LLIASFIVMGVLYFKLKKLSVDSLIVTENTEQTQPTESEPIKPIEPEIATGTDAFGSFISNKNGAKDYTQNFKTSGLDVEWFGGAITVSEKDSDNLLSKIFPDYIKIKDVVDKINNSAECKNDTVNGQSRCWMQDPNIYLYAVGKIKNIDNATLYYIFVPRLYEDSMGDNTLVLLGFIDAKTKTLIAVINPNQAQESKSAISGGIYGINGARTEYLKEREYIEKLSSNTTNFSVFSGYVAYEFEELNNPPSVLDVPETSSKIISVGQDDYIYFYLDDYGNAGITNPYKQEVETGRFSQLPIAFQTPEGLSVYKDEQCYFIIKPNGTVIRYNLVPSFISWETEATKEYYGDFFETSITWNDGSKNSDTYTLAGDHTSRGCGGPALTACTNVVNKKTWFDANKLVRTGTGKNGEKIFEIKNAADNEFYNDTFYKVFLPDPETQFFADFLKDHPIIFWQDHLGNWRTFKKTKYQPQAECGKPVIYLYPEKDTDVKVEVKPNGGFTKTEPMYDNGWFVHATPQSELFNYTDKTSYPYLFWEGKAYNFITPNYGFVMSKKDVSTKMTQILTKLGLNEKETIDFLEFWQPKLEVKPYVFVTFLPQREFDKLAPLTVNPKPDTIIRVFMDYTPLDAPVKVAPMQIRTPERVGFTVVEWGGKLN